MIILWHIYFLLPIIFIFNLFFYVSLLRLISFQKAGPSKDQQLMKSNGDLNKEESAKIEEKNSKPVNKVKPLQQSKEGAEEIDSKSMIRRVICYLP